eukprot:g4153.t1
MFVDPVKSLFSFSLDNLKEEYDDQRGDGKEKEKKTLKPAEAVENSRMSLSAADILGLSTSGKNVDKQSKLRATSRWRKDTKNETIDRGDTSFSMLVDVKNQTGLRAQKKPKKAAAEKNPVTRKAKEDSRWVEKVSTILTSNDALRGRCGDKRRRRIENRGYGLASGGGEEEEEEDGTYFTYEESKMLQGVLGSGNIDDRSGGSDGIRSGGSDTQSSYRNSNSGIETGKDYEKGTHRIVDVEDPSFASSSPTRPKLVHLYAVQITLSHTEKKDTKTGWYTPQFDETRRKRCAIAVNYNNILCIPEWSILKLTKPHYFGDFYKKFVSKPHLTGKGSKFYDHALRLKIKTLRMTSPDFCRGKGIYLIVEAEVEFDTKSCPFDEGSDITRKSKNSGIRFLKIETNPVLLQELCSLILFHQDVAVAVNNLSSYVLEPERIARPADTTETMIGRGTFGKVFVSKIDGNNEYAIKCQELKEFSYNAGKVKARDPPFKDPDFRFRKLRDLKDSRKMRYRFNFKSIRELKTATSIKVRNILSTDFFLLDYHRKNKVWQLLYFMRNCEGGSLADELKHAKPGTPWKGTQKNKMKEDFHARWHGNLIPTDPTNLEAYITPRNQDTVPLRDDFNYLILEDIVRGMCHLHDEEIVHRDLKPDNILLTWDIMSGRTIAKICDFGTAKQDDAKSSDDAQTFCGTRQFMAPELIDRKRYSEIEKNKKKLDVYAFSGIVYHMWTARVPFHDAEDNPSKYRGLLRAINVGVPEGLRPTKKKETPFGNKVESFLDACWHDNPAKRPSFIEIKRDLLERFKPEHLRKDNGKDNGDGYSWVQRKQEKIVKNFPRIVAGVRAWASDVLEKRKSQVKAEVYFERTALKQKLEDYGVDRDAYTLYRPLTDYLQELHKKAYNEGADEAKAKIRRFYRANPPLKSGGERSDDGDDGASKISTKMTDGEDVPKISTKKDRRGLL